MFAVQLVQRNILLLLLHTLRATMATPTTILVMLLSLFGPTLSNEEQGGKKILWSNLTPLQLAAMDGRIEDVEDILSQKKESANSTAGMSSLHWAALRGSVPLIRVLLRHGAAAASLDEDGSTVLHMAAASGSPDAVRELLLANVDINAQDHLNRTALHLAVSKQDFEVVKTLLRFGALTNVTDQEGRSALDLAVEINNLLVTSLLRSTGAKKVKYALESYGKTNTTPSTTMVASTTTKPPNTQLPKATRRPEWRKLTAKEMRMHEAAKISGDNIIADLCAEGVDPNVADIQNNGYTALHLAATVNAKLSLLTLARCSANLNAKDYDGNTPLHIAVMEDYPWIADILLMLGANPNIRNNERKLPQDLVTPSKKLDFRSTFNPELMKWVSDIRNLSKSEENLRNFVQNGYYWTVADSCKNGVDIHVKDIDHKQYTLLHHAITIKSNVPGTIQMLLRCGADINARDADGNTPLHIAVMRKLDEAYKVLLLNGADLFIANKDGKTAYQLLKEDLPQGIDNRLQWYMNRMPL